MSDDERMHGTGSEVAGAPASSESTPHFHRRVTSFRARRSTISDNQQAVWDRLWPSLGTQARDGEHPAGLLDTDAWFGRHAPVVLEIGCGTGTSTLAMAHAEPDIDVVAVEVYRRGLAQLLAAIDRASATDPVPNIRLIRGDGVDVLTHMFPTASLTGVRVFFPDPWPKARHHKRRLLQPDTVALIADRLAPGGILHAATDHLGYAEHVAEVGDNEPRLRRVDPARADLPISVARPVTKYERKALAGTTVAELLWERT
ncbi:tRNA (guanosine(46)-N7)-methyltransferase TrmB [Mycolicibacterium duvalii]|uniref:tRNA (guanine-N(7)-)-methyltransferase n=1 Tax=Mycolicibacterium duvalii TaxID=39688 RepID=A0A7I7K6T9_9MYCO|nr:tRNA (guanosine(46)-N7)-methyltransferase TrmB [Mycolicibacterium duvalii]MCV7368863.1 tRNA (guanosine(46)-N7)-methyltransferase TrmB [Mycolicibacterium duvalii]PEG44363.1 tRNA (guanosine(46)-N7)-methyltransferase TrmB [Mycolicibacterium duvalii]BBX19239.1 tRNA (guanine-N(7)-)-methyltransferase [Mycolicibacterium duvalii]